MQNNGRSPLPPLLNPLLSGAKPFGPHAAVVAEIVTEWLVVGVDLATGKEVTVRCRSKESVNDTVKRALEKQREALRPTEQEGVFTLLVEEWKTTKELKERKRITMPHKPQEKEDFRVFFE